MPTQADVARSDAASQSAHSQQTFSDSLNTAAQNPTHSAKAGSAVSKAHGHRYQSADGAENKGSDTVNADGTSALALSTPPAPPLPQTLISEDAGVSGSTINASEASHCGSEPFASTVSGLEQKSALGASAGTSQVNAVPASAPTPTSSTVNSTGNPGEEALRLKISAELAVALGAATGGAVANVLAKTNVQASTGAPKATTSTLQGAAVELPSVKNGATPVAAIDPMIAGAQVVPNGVQTAPSNGIGAAVKGIGKSGIDAVSGKDGGKANGKNDSLPSSTSSSSPSTQFSSVVQQTSAAGNQSSHDGSMRDQASTPTPVAAITHAASASGSAQSPAMSTLVQPASASTLTGSATAKTSDQDPTGPATAATPDTMPVISSAKLIQSIGQTEMRVGMQSAEFGNISIHTSSSSGLVSAQISLDHGELAKALASHLPEMQSRLGSDQAMDVRINNTAQAGVSSGLGNSSGGAQYQQGSRTTSGPATAAQRNQYASVSTIAGTSISTGSNGRLSIQA